MQVRIAVTNLTPILLVDRPIIPPDRQLLLPLAEAGPTTAMSADPPTILRPHQQNADHVLLTRDRRIHQETSSRQTAKLISECCARCPGKIFPSSVDACGQPRGRACSGCCSQGGCRGA